MANYPRWDTSTGPVKCKHCRAPILPGTDIYIKSKGVYYCMGCGTLKENAPATVLAGGIEEGLLKDLAQFPEEAADSSLARAALFMAKQLDEGEVSPREITQYTKEIRLNYLQLRDLFQAEDEDDDTEDRRAKLQERRRREQGGI